MKENNVFSSFERFRSWLHAIGRIFKKIYSENIYCMGWTKYFHSIVLSSIKLLISAEFLKTAINSLNFLHVHYQYEIIFNCHKLFFVFLPFSVHNYSSNWSIIKLAFRIHKFKFSTVFYPDCFIGLSCKGILEKTRDFH